uniref:Uncharacterized protein n=1 Tax=Panagrolaimus davidi TaxID=227884 RepID=A0A914PFL4_9BILA
MRCLFIFAILAASLNGINGSFYYYPARGRRNAVIDLSKVDQNGRLGGKYQQYFDGYHHGHPHDHRHEHHDDEDHHHHHEHYPHDPHSEHYPHHDERHLQQAEYDDNEPKYYNARGRRSFGYWGHRGRRSAGFGGAEVDKNERGVGGKYRTHQNSAGAMFMPPAPEQKNYNNDDASEGRVDSGHVDYHKAHGRRNVINPRHRSAEGPPRKGWPGSVNRGAADKHGKNNVSK